MNELKRAVGGAAAELVTALIPAIKGIVSLATMAARAVNGLVDGIRSLFTGSFMGEWKAPGEVRKLSAEAMKAREETRKLREEMQRLTDIEGQRQVDAIFDRFKGTAITTFEPISDAIVSQFDKIVASIESMKGRAARIFEATRTPAERFAAQLKEIKELASTGFLDTDTARRAIAQLNREQQVRFMQQPMPDMSPSRVSFAALGAEAAAGRGQDRLEKNTADEVKESRKQTTLQRKANEMFGRALQRGQIKTVQF